MANPIVIAHHLIWTAYGWWLPNDPRGSTSHVIKCDVIAQLGELHHGRKVVQPAGREIRAFYDEAKTKLKHSLLRIDDNARDIIASAFAETIAKFTYTCYACVIMPDHVHILIRKHRDTCEQMFERLKTWSARALRANGWCDVSHPVWTDHGGWKVFLVHPDDVERTIGYIEANPDARRLPRQQYDFVKTYDRWPLHEGHSERSPYVRRLKAVGRYP